MNSKTHFGRSFCRVTGCLMLTAGFIQCAWNSIPSPLRPFVPYEQISQPSEEKGAAEDKKALESLIDRHDRLLSRARKIEESYFESMACALAGGLLLFLASLHRDRNRHEAPLP
jgi:hypothetical protein